MLRVFHALSFLLSSHFLKVKWKLFRNYLPLEKDGALYLNKLKFLSPKNALFQVWLKLAKWFWRRRLKCEKFTDGRTDRQTDRRRTTGDPESSLELSAKNWKRLSFFVKAKECSVVWYCICIWIIQQVSHTPVYNPRFLWI